MKIAPIIEADELLKIYRNPEVMLFDASGSANAHAQYKMEHLEGAVFVDPNSMLADIKDNFAQGGRHPLPQPVDFARTLTELGITRDKHLIIYDDNNGSNAAARFWWMLKAAGHEQVQVLNGGLKQAKLKNVPVNAAIFPVKRNEVPYPVVQWQWPTIQLEEVERIAQNTEFRVIDVRSKERYDGLTEPIDLVAGHIPGAINIPFSENLDENGLFLPPGVLRKKYEQQLVQIQPENCIVHCGSGVTACHTILAFDYAGLPVPRLYVGSWSEWSRNEKEIAK